MTTERAFLVFPDGRVEEIDEEGETSGGWKTANLHADLAAAGYPPFREEGSPFDGGFDITVKDDNVTVHAYDEAGIPAAREMGPAGELFLAWLRDND
ncbi:hypothetical protein [Paractinoplanes toevensis]|nr:hypothetical protein [Actinoplanes toevensis]